MMVALPTLAQTTEDYDRLDALAQQLPADAKAIIERSQACHELGGEEGDGDAEREAELTKIAEDNACGTVKQDEAAMRRKYSASPKVAAAFDLLDSFK